MLDISIGAGIHPIVTTKNPTVASVQGEGDSKLAGLGSIFIIAAQKAAIVAKTSTPIMAFATPSRASKCPASNINSIAPKIAADAMAIETLKGKK